jgi:hypothetical protein
MSIQKSRQGRYIFHFIKEEIPDIIEFRLI